jgi:hypothetical protein
MTAWRVGLMGPVGVGKDRVAAAIRDRLGPGHTAVNLKIGTFVIDDLDAALRGRNLPDPLPGGVLDHLDGLRDELHAVGVDASVAQHPDTLRRRSALRWWGALRRERDEGYWLDRFDAVLDEHRDKNLVSVTDVRREPEMELLRRRSYLMVQLYASRAVCASRAATRDGAAQPERVWIADEWTERDGPHPLADLVVNNESTPESAAAEIVAVLDRWPARTEDRSSDDSPGVRR